MVLYVMLDSTQDTRTFCVAIENILLNPSYPTEYPEAMGNYILLNTFTVLLTDGFGGGRVEDEYRLKQSQ